jgi:hypothetical protein
MRATKVEVQEHQIFLLRHKLTKDTLSQQFNDFPKLPLWLTRLHKENRNHNNREDFNRSNRLVIDLLLTEDHMFRRIFVGPHTSEAQWVHSMPFVALNGTYLRNCFRQTLLLAVGRNGNNKS